MREGNFGRHFKKLEGQLRGGGGEQGFSIQIEVKNQ